MRGVLEISGTETSSELTRRHQEKVHKHWKIHLGLMLILLFVPFPRLDIKSDFLIIVGRREHMQNLKTKPYTKALKGMMSQKSEILSKAQTLSDIGIPETAQSLWLSAANYEEHIAPMLDVLGRELEVLYIVSVQHPATRGLGTLRGL